MSSPATAPITPAQQASKRLPGVVYLLAGVTFLIGTTELILAGLLPQVASSLNVSQGQAGLLITVFAAGMIVGAPVMSMLTLRLPARRILVLALLVFAAGHVISAIATDFTLQVIARLLAALATGTFWAVGATLASAAAGPGKTARATSMMVSGLTLANVIGVPLGAALGQWLGWRAPFWILAVLATLAAILLGVLLPKATTERSTTLTDEARPLRQGRIWVVYLACALLPAAFIAAYSYVAPILTDRAHLGAELVPLVMLGYGIGTVIGSLLGGRLGDNRPYGTMIPATVLITVILAALTAWGDNTAAAITLFILLGLVAMIAQPILVSQAIHLAGTATTLAVALSTSALNAGFALGSWLGGLVLATPLAVSGPSLVGAVFGALAALTITALALTRHRPTHQPVDAPTPSQGSRGIASRP